MSVHSVVAVPAAPLRPADGPAGAPVHELLTHARAALRAPADLATQVLLAAGPSGVVHDRAAVDAHGAREDGGEVEVPVDAELMAVLAGRTGFSRGRTDRLGGDLAELVRWCAELAPETSLLPVEIPEHAGSSTLEAVATGLRAAIETSDRAVRIVAAGDLAASPSPGSGDGRAAAHPPGSEAARFDERLVEALRARDVPALTALGPGPAREVGARGWAPLAVVGLLARMTGLDVGEPHYLAHEGRGRVVFAP